MSTSTRTSRIADTFARLRRSAQPAMIPYLTVGYPQLDTVRRVVPALVEGGADIIELGIPFSDPLADGVTIQQSSQVALRNGVTLAYCLQTARDLRHNGVDAPLILMGYFNPILRFGLQRFAAECAECGVDGVIIPDLPVGESGEMLAACREHGRDLIFMLAPTSTDELIAEVAGQASGFIYCVSLAGVTGARSTLAAGVDAFLARVRRATDLPLALGFGISTPEHVVEAARLADGVVVGSALVSRLGRTPSERQPDEMKLAIEQLRSGLGKTEAAGSG